MSLNPHVYLYKPLSMYEPHVCVYTSLCVSLLPLCVSILPVYVSMYLSHVISHAPHCFCLIPPVNVYTPTSMSKHPVFA